MQRMVKLLEYFREHPASVGESSGDFACVFFDANLRMLRGKQHVMIQLCGDFEKLGSDEQEIDDKVVRVERSGDFGSDVVVVAVESFAMVSERDEMSRAKNMLGLRDSNLE